MNKTSAIAMLLVVLMLAACGGRAEPTPTKTPRPTDTATPLPTLAVAMPLVESGGDGQQSAAAGAERISPLETPTPTPLPPTPTPMPGFEARPPILVLVADLACGQGCNAGNPEGIGQAMFNLDTNQFNTVVANLDMLQNQVYEGWIVEDGTGRVESSGRFNTKEDGTRAASRVLSGDLTAVPWTSFVLTVEPEPDDDGGPAAPHSIGGPFRRSFMGEAIFNRFDIACGACHGLAGAGDGAAASGPALANTGLSFPEFETAVRAHAGDAYDEGVLGSRDLQHIYAWLISLQ